MVESVSSSNALMVQNTGNSPYPFLSEEMRSADRQSPFLTKDKLPTDKPAPFLSEEYRAADRPSPFLSEEYTATGNTSPFLADEYRAADRPSPFLAEEYTATGNASPFLADEYRAADRPSPFLAEEYTAADARSALSIKRYGSSDETNAGMSINLPKDSNTILAELSKNPASSTMTAREIANKYGISFIQAQDIYVSLNEDANGIVKEFNIPYNSTVSFLV